MESGRESERGMLKRIWLIVKVKQAQQTPDCVSCLTTDKKENIEPHSLLTPGKCSKSKENDIIFIILHFFMLPQACENVC